MDACSYIAPCLINDFAGRLAPDGPSSCVDYAIRARMRTAILNLDTDARTKTLPYTQLISDRVILCWRVGIRCAESVIDIVCTIRR